MVRSVAFVMLVGSLLGACTPQPWTLDRAEANRLYAQGRYSEALPLNRKVIESRPGTAQYQYELGRTLLALGRPQEAREAMTVAHEVAPEVDLYAEGLADAMIEAGEYESALSMLRNRAETRGGLDDYLRLGEFAQKAGNVDEAHRAYVDAAGQWGQTSAEPHRALARLYESAGDTPAAVERWRNVLWFDPADAEAAQHLRSLGYVPGPTAARRPRAEAPAHPSGSAPLPRTATPQPAPVRESSPAATDPVSETPQPGGPVVTGEMEDVGGG